MYIWIAESNNISSRAHATKRDSQCGYIIDKGFVHVYTHFQRWIQYTSGNWKFKNLKVTFMYRKVQWLFRKNMISLHLIIVCGVSYFNRDSLLLMMISHWTTIILNLIRKHVIRQYTHIVYYTIRCNLLYDGRFRMRWKHCECVRV